MKNSRPPIKPDTDNEYLPPRSARFIAFLAMVMSLGFALLLAVFFLKSLFQGLGLVLAFSILITLSFFSATVALRTVLPKLICPHCQQPFFNQVRQLFGKPGNCQHCGQSVI